MSSYQFTTAYPPRFKHHGGAILDIPPDSLERQIGTASWSYHIDYPPTPVGNLGRDEMDVITVRTYRWVLVPPVIRFAVDTTRNLKVTKGYTQHEASTFERTINASISGGLSKVFAAEVAANLKITRQTDQTWRLEEIETIDQTFSAGKSYAIWVLYDVLHAEKRGVLKDPRTGRILQDYGVTSSSISNALIQFNDEFVLNDITLHSGVQQEYHPYFADPIKRSVKVL